MFSTWPEILFWAAALILFYQYAGYPVLLAAWGALRQRRPGAPPPPAPPPTLSVLLVALDEGPRMEGRVRNLLSLGYPADRLEILVGSDGSRDDTMHRALAVGDPRVRVFAFPQRRGKPAVLNDLMRWARGSILVFADARQRFEPGSLHALAGPFSDPEVGGVSGELVLDHADGAVGDGVGLYWKIETFIRKTESLVDSCIGATGAIYAVRRDLVEPIPEDTLLDDVLIPMRAARRGYRVVLQPQARAHDRAARSPREEFSRKVRTIAGNFQLFAREPWMLDPRRNRLWLQTWSHKALRLAGPACLAALASTSVALAWHPFYRAALAAQALLAACALLASLRTSVRSRILAVPYVLFLLHWATVVAFFRFVTGRQRVTWERAAAPGGAGLSQGR